MKNWKVVWVSITGSIFFNEFNTFEEMESWLSAAVLTCSARAEKITVWERFENEWKTRLTYKKA